MSYEAKTGHARVIFRDVPLAESDEEKPGPLSDYEVAGNIAFIELLDASRGVEDAGKVAV